MAPEADSNSKQTSTPNIRDREEIQFLTELAYTLQRQNRANLRRLSILMSRTSGMVISADQLDTLFHGLSLDMKPAEIEQVRYEDIMAGIEAHPQI